jgi:DNA-binding transcriptional regulator/RsmH inhibitor MraZ
VSSRSKSKNTLGTDQVAWVGKDRRVVVKRDLVQAALGLKLRAGKTIDLWALVGANRQIQLLPPESDLARLRDSYKQLGTEKVMTWDASDHDKTATHRRLAGLFQITCRARRQSRNLRITLPPELVDLDLLRTKEALVLVVVGNVVELWRRDRWTEMAAIANLSEFTQDVREVMENDE